MFRRISTMALVCLLTLTAVSLDYPLKRVSAQKKSVPEEPFQVVDASTGKTIPEILVIPLYSCYRGIFVPPEGPSKASVRNYVDSPFVYRTGEPFRIKQPRFFTGLPLLFVFIGEGRDLDGMLVIAPKYRPHWTDDLWWYPWNPSYERKLELYPVSDSEWSQILENELSPFLKGASRVNDNCWMWALPKDCDLKIRYGKKKRELVRTFLQKAGQETK